jgi:hypothetical protein
MLLARVRWTVNFVNFRAKLDELDSPHPPRAYVRAPTRTLDAETSETSAW